jgi:regulatory protein YycI of two-component signal transduction system YycFG
LETAQQVEVVFSRLDKGQNDLKNINNSSSTECKLNINLQKQNLKLPLEQTIAITDEFNNPQNQAFNSTIVSDGTFKKST